MSDQMPPSQPAPGAPARANEARSPRVSLMLSEWWYARRASRDLRGWYDRVHSEEPRLTGRPLYNRVLVRRSGLDANAADLVLRRAEQSFSDWSSDRDLRFRDVVLYVVIEEWMRNHLTRVGARTHMERVVARAIPGDL